MRSTLTSDNISTAEAALLLRCSQRTVERMIERGTLHAKKLDPQSRSIYILSRQDVLDLAQRWPARGMRKH